MSDRPERLDPKAREKVRVMIDQAVKVMSDMKHLDDSKKDIINEIHQQFGITKKYLNKMAKARFKHSYGDIQAEHEDFEFLYESIFDVARANEGETQ